MPYIKTEDRQKIDGAIDDLAKRIAEMSQGSDGAFAGLLNYTCTRLTMAVIRRRFGQMRYWIIAIVSGTFKNIADEFYRRVGTPYENKQIKTNQDVDFYKDFDDEMAHEG